jgi:ubiquinone/menaquinone biosynthesis C-methylase UbiE
VGGLEFDESLGEQLEVVYRTRDILRRRRLVHEALGAQEGERILDVGCGPGFYVAELLDAVGPGGSVVGVDVSPAMLAIAAHRTEAHPNVAFHEAEATSLPFGDEDFDAALSVQVFEYVRDIPAALGEIHRALRPSGRVVLWDVDWTTLSWHSAEPERMRRALAAWDEHLAHPSLPRTLAAELRRAGFEDIRAEGHVFATTELDPETYGGANLPLIENYIAGRQGGGPEEAAAWAAEQRELGERGEFFFSVTQFCFSAHRP